MNTEEELTQLKTKIQNAKIEMNKLEGRRTALLERLKTEFRLSGLKEAEAQLEKIKNEKEKLEKKLEEKLEDIREMTDEFDL